LQNGEGKSLSDYSEYLRMLDEVYKDVPRVRSSGEWFAIPQLKIEYEGDKSILVNFKEICELFRREPSHVMKFLVRNLATAGYVTDDLKLVLQGHFNEDQIMNLLNRYVSFFVRCQNCGRPDTRLIKKAKVVYMVCEACGAEAPIKITA
jgi:translation initiation factor 2 subunit 2